MLLCRKKKFVEERERPEGEERESRGGYLVVVLASCGGAGGGEACGGSGWWLEQRGERGREKYCRNEAERLVFSDFWTQFLLSQVINGASIYKRWKRIISSTPGQNFSPRFGWEGSQPLVQSSVPELTSSRRRRCRRAVFHPETFTWGCRGTAGDPFRASFVRFDGEIKH